MSRRAVEPVQTKTQWAALSSVVRVEMIQCLRVAGPCSIRELADVMRRQIQPLYFHLRKLERAGLVKQTGIRKARRQNEALYDLVAQRFHYIVDARSGRNVKEFKVVLQAMLRACAKQTLAAVSAGVDFESPLIEVGRRAGWLTESQARQVARLIGAALKIVQSSRRTPTSRLHAMTAVFLPIPERGARKR